MIFQNPWVWLGVLAIAGPIAAHLLARRPARRQPFPHLRFLPAAALKPVRRDRLADISLLLVRAGVVAAAVAALTQPLWLSADRARDLGRQIARAVIVDTSASMQGAVAASGGATRLDAARREATSAAADATVARVAETPAPATVVAGAVNWLHAQPMRRELIVVSDFQETSITRADLDMVPTEVGVKVIRVEAGATVTTGTTGTTGTAGVTLLTGPDERSSAAAAREAAIAQGAPVTGRADRPIAIVFPQYESRDSLTKSARPLTESWMFDAWFAVRHDAALEAASRRADRLAADIVSVGVGAVEGVDRLLLFTTEPAHRLTSAALIAAALRISVNEPAAAELSPTRRSDAELRTWERPASAVAPSGSSNRTDASDGRWLWAAALVLLFVEMRLRRPRAVIADPEASHARVA